MSETDKVDENRQQNEYGSLGEDAVSLQFRTPVEKKGKVLFVPEFMGAKACLLDFLVRLNDPDKSGGTDPHYFFVQVKSAYEDSAFYPNAENPTALSVKFSAKNVYEAQCMHAPVYLVAVDCRDPQRLEPYVCGISGDRTEGVRHVKMERANALKEKATKEKIAEEVRKYFMERPDHPFETSFDKYRIKKTEAADAKRQTSK
jgi:hypothetical protein